MGEISGRPSTLVVIVGPPAVGKMTVGVELSALTGFPVFHNHVSIEAVLPVFPFGTPEFDRLVGAFRMHVLREVASSDLRGLIYTVMFDFGNEDELSFAGTFESIFEANGGRVVFVELEADLETRLERNGTAARLAAKPSKRDVAASRARVLAAHEGLQLNSTGDDPFSNYLRIDNSNRAPEEVAEQIATHFDLGQDREDERRPPV